MTESGATGAIVTSTAVTLGSTISYGLTGQGKLPQDRVIVGGFLAMTGCAVLAEVNSNLGGYLAIAVALTAFTTYGVPTLNHYFSKNKSK